MESPNGVNATEWTVRGKINAAAPHHIHAGRHRFFVLALIEETKKLVQQRERIRLLKALDILLIVF